MHLQKKKNNKKTIIIGAVLLILLLVSLFLFLHRGGENPSAPAVTVETPAKMEEKDRDPFSLELQLTSLGETVYPAASFSISFDSAKLEFLGVSEGNVIIKNSESISGTTLPEWNVNTERSNETGIINIMYIDMTGGKNAFSKELLREQDNVLLLLDFRLRGSVRAGDILELGLDDAVFAASDEAESLSSAAGTLRTGNGRIIIGDSK